MGDFLESCANAFDSGKILAVSHGVAIRALILPILRLPIKNIWDFEIEGASVTKVTITNKTPIIEYIGKTISIE